MFLCVCIVFASLCIFLNEICQLILETVFCVIDRRRTQILVLIWRICVFAQWTCLSLELKLLPLLYAGDCYTWSTTLTYKVYMCVRLISVISHPWLFCKRCLAGQSCFGHVHISFLSVISAVHWLTLFPAFIVCRESPGWDRYCYWFIQTALSDWQRKHVLY